MDAALNQLQSQQIIYPEDVARLSPLGFEHINILGRYSFNLSEDLKNGAMRPLRDWNDLNEFETELY